MNSFHLLFYNRVGSRYCRCKGLLSVSKIWVHPVYLSVYVNFENPDSTQFWNNLSTIQTYVREGVVVDIYGFQLVRRESEQT